MQTVLLYGKYLNLTIIIANFCYFICQVSDVGLTGLTEVPDLEFPTYSTNLNDRQSSAMFHLGSKAEREILFEAKRKMEIAEQITPYKKMMQLCGKDSMGIGRLAGYQILMKFILQDKNEFLYQ